MLSTEYFTLLVYESIHDSFLKIIPSVWSPRSKYDVLWGVAMVIRSRILLILHLFLVSSMIKSFIS